MRRDCGVLVAAMKTHGVNRILTFNVADFARFTGITVIDPVTVPAVPGTVPPPDTP